MKADWNDAPSYIKANSKRANARALIVPGIIGTCVTLGLLQIAGSAFLTGIVHNLAEKPTPAKPTPITEITRTEKLSAKDWDRAVELQARLRAQLQQPAPATQPQTVKQTVFNDGNYIPRGADNILSLVSNASEPALQEKKAKVGRLTIIEQSPTMKDMACWPHQEGSISRRNCRSHIGLNYRD